MSIRVPTSAGNTIIGVNKGRFIENHIVVLAVFVNATYFICLHTRVAKQCQIRLMVFVSALLRDHCVHCVAHNVLSRQADDASNAALQPIYNPSGSL